MAGGRWRMESANLKREKTRELRSREESDVGCTNSSTFWIIELEGCAEFRHLAILALKSSLVDTVGFLKFRMRLMCFFSNK